MINMLAQRETMVSLFIAAVAILVVIGGFASFSGLAAYSGTLSLDFSKSSFSGTDAFDVDLIIEPVTLMADESAVV